MKEIDYERIGEPSPAWPFAYVAMIVVGCVIYSGLWHYPWWKSLLGLSDGAALLIWLTAGPLVGVGLLSFIKMPVRGFVIGIVGQFALTGVLLGHRAFWSSSMDVFDFVLLAIVVFFTAWQFHRHAQEKSRN
jgi:hypothetical protein